MAYYFLPGVGALNAGIVSLERIDLNLSRPSDVRRPFPVYNCLVNKDGPKLKSFSPTPPDCHNGPRSDANQGKSPLSVTFWQKEYIPHPLNVTICRTLNVTGMGRMGFFGATSVEKVQNWQESDERNCSDALSGTLQRADTSSIPGSYQYGTFKPEYKWLRDVPRTDLLLFVFNDTTTMDLR